MRRKEIVDIEKAIEMYWSLLSLGNKEIQELFGCGGTSAWTYKQEVHNYIARHNADPNNKRIVINSHFRVPTKIAFLAWGLDIDELEKMFSKLYRFKSKKIKEA